MLVKTGSDSYRHFKALMKKNTINWRRTWCGSCLECACPVLLMLILVWSRTAFDVTTTGDIDLYMLQTPFYPAAKLDSETDTWSVTTSQMLQKSVELLDFFTYTEYPVVTALNGTYNTIIDPKSPYNWMPEHCYQPKEGYNSPYVAVILENNVIETDLI